MDNPSDIANPKGKLQEYCQQNQFSLPEYEVNNINTGIAHYPLFSATVTLWDGRTFNTADNNISSLTNKKKAEHEAARLALFDIYHKMSRGNQNRNNNSSFIFNKANVIIIVDAENQQKASDDIKSAISSDCIDYHVYCSRDYILACNTNGILKKEILSTRSDAADIGIILWLGSLMNNDMTDFDAVFIVSNDHFAETVSDVLNRKANISFKTVPCRNSLAVINRLREWQETNILNI